MSSGELIYSCYFRSVRVVLQDSSCIYTCLFSAVVMATQWDSEKTIAFIQEYKTHECPWNFKSPQYRNKQMREAAYKQIADAMGIEGFGIIAIIGKIHLMHSFIIFFHFTTSTHIATMLTQPLDA